MVSPSKFVSITECLSLWSFAVKKHHDYDKKKVFNWWIAYCFRSFVHYTHDSIQADMVAESPIWIHRQQEEQKAAEAVLIFGFSKAQPQ